MGAEGRNKNHGRSRRRNLEESPPDPAELWSWDWPDSWAGGQSWVGIGRKLGKRGYKVRVERERVKRGYMKAHAGCFTTNPLIKFQKDIPPTHP